jgi:hypothetical protein
VARRTRALMERVTRIAQVIIPVCFIMPLGLARAVKR